MSPEELEAIRGRHQSDMRWCAELDVPPSDAAIDQRSLLAEVERLQAELEERDMAALEAREREDSSDV